MDVARSRRPDRSRSPYHSHSRSPRSRRIHRSSSRERYRYNPSPRTRKRTSLYKDRAREYGTSPIRLSPRSRYHSNMKSDGRLKQPEVQSSILPPVDLSLESNTSPSALTNPAPVSLTERFMQITSSGTSLYNTRFPGRLLEAHHLPHLIITNNPLLPQATLIRQAKTISVVVERKFPPGKRRTISMEPVDSALSIPRRPSEGFRPVFDRPEMVFYQTSADESQILKRLVDSIKPSTKPPLSERIRSNDRQQFPEVTIATVGRFFGSRVDESKSGSHLTHPLDPLETPRNPAYFMHDTREDTDLTSRRHWRTRFPNTTAGYRRDYRDRRSPGSPERSYPSHIDSPATSDRWQHDKFEQIRQEDSGVTAPTLSKPTPKPVPAPKPILWSTIGKEIVNGEPRLSTERQPYTDTRARSVTSRRERDCPASSRRYGNQEQLDHSSQTVDDYEDVRIDAEPVLVDES